MNYRIAGRVVVPDETGRILLVEQVPDFWLIPGGGVEEGETPTQAAIRELREETGLDVEILRLIWCTERYQPDFNHLSLGFIYLGRAAGGTLGSGELRVAFFDLSTLEQEARWPGGGFWKRVASISGPYTSVKGL